MQTQVVIRGVKNANGIRAFAEEKLLHGLERFADQVMGAVLCLEDVTGPAKGGVDKLCHIDVKMRRGDIHIRQQGDDFHATVDIAMDRLRRQLSKHINKHKRGIGAG